MKTKHKIWLCFMVTLTMFMATSKELTGTERRSTATRGSIGFTGHYDPIGATDPTPSESIGKPPVEDVNNPFINLPQTNSITNRYLRNFGIAIIALCVVRFKHLKKLNYTKAGKNLKLIKLATVTALTSSILAGGSKIVSAEVVHNVDTEGNVQFAPGGGEDEEVEVLPPVVDPDAPEVDIQSEDPNMTGPLSIVKAVTMNFRSQVISNQTQYYSMVVEMQQLEGTTGDENKVPYVSFAQVQDVRGTNGGWNLQVSLSDFTLGTHNGVLTGAEIEFVEGRVSHVTNNPDNTPAGHQNGLKLIPNVGAVSVMTADRGQGAGSSSIVWGNQRDLNQQFADAEKEVVENHAIRLFVPGSTAKDAATYTSTPSADA